MVRTIAPATDTDRVARGLWAFLRELDGYAQRVPLDELVRRMEALQITFDDVREFARFNAERYQRNLLHSGPGYSALVLCWRNGQRSPIHNHRGSSCGVRVLPGEATETFFERNANGHVYATGSRVLREGAVCGSQDDDIHQVSNLQSGNADLVTLHVYSPPLLSMQVFSLTDTTVRDFYDPVFAFCDGDGI
jgi:cysteine dioxygenase